MTVAIHVTIPDEKAVQAALDYVTAITSSENLALVATRELVPVLQRRAAERFASEGDTASGKWEPLRDSTVERRIAEGYPGSHPINVRTGEMKQAVTGAKGTTSMIPDGAELEWPDINSVGGIQDKLNTAQMGASQAGSADTVPRPVIAADGVDLQLTMQVLESYLQLQLSKGGLI